MIKRKYHIYYSNLVSIGRIGKYYTLKEAKKRIPILAKLNNDPYAVYWFDDIMTDEEWDKLDVTMYINARHT